MMEKLTEEQIKKIKADKKKSISEPKINK